MKKRDRAASSILFLTELFLAIMIFTIASAVCVQFFVKSHLLSNRSQELTQASNECSVLAEICKVSDSPEDALEQIQELYPLAQVNAPVTEAVLTSDQTEKSAAGTDSSASDIAADSDTEELSESYSAAGSASAPLYAFTIFYNKDFQPCAAADSVYELTFGMTGQDTLFYADMTYQKQDDIIYELTTAHHYARSTPYAQR